MIRRAVMKDVLDIKKLIDAEAKMGRVLPRSLKEIYETIRDFVVVELDGAVVGCCAVHVTWDGLAEIRSAIVLDDVQNLGWGTKLVTACIEDARGLGIARVFTLTYVPGFFEKVGFHRVNKSELPQKVWADCINCIHFPDCQEVALIYQLQ